MSEDRQDPALRKIVAILGTDRAREIFTKVLRRIGRDELQTPQDRYLFAEELMKQGGVLEAVGRSIKIQAILLGARGR